jgi:hypothetical protein
MERRFTQSKSIEKRLVAVTNMRLSAVASAANLMAQLCELNELRDRLWKAQLSARRSDGGALEAPALTAR